MLSFYCTPYFSKIRFRATFQPVTNGTIPAQGGQNPTSLSVTVILLLPIPSLQPRLAQGIGMAIFPRLIDQRNTLHVPFHGKVGIDPHDF